MVRKVLSKYGESPPADGSSDRKIVTSTPINPIDEVIEALDQNPPKPMTKRGVANLQQMRFDLDDLKELVRDAVSYGRYRDSEWCEFSETSPWFACDSYEIKRREYIENAHKYLEVCYFVKFCIHKSGSLICTFSCHFSS